MELHSAAILEVWFRQDAKPARSMGGCAAAASAAAALAFLRRPILSAWCGPAASGPSKRLPVEGSSLQGLRYVVTAPRPWLARM